MSATRVSTLSLFPETAEISAEGHLWLGGCCALDLVAHFGTPLYVFDEATLRGQCRRFVSEFTSRYPKTHVLYASKAFLNRPLAQLMKEEDLGLDVVSGGELAIAQSVGFPMEHVHFHGNNKGEQELREALEAGIGRVVVDNFDELALLDSLAGETGKRLDILLRISPGVDAHTHAHTTTGILDSKFGFPIATGQAEQAVAQAAAARHLHLVGLHMHLGSPLFEIEPYLQAIPLMLSFAAEMKAKHSLELREFSPGGGFAVSYIGESPAPPIANYAQAITGCLIAECRRLGLEPPALVIEPGRSIVGRAGVALYRVGTTKDIPGLRKYVSLDGGMGDNIRPALYGSQYEALVAGRAAAQPEEKVNLAGKFCESGDILIRDIDLPRLARGDIVALPAAGAYCLAMASNYNASLRPAVIMVKDGAARLIRRRETYEDLMRCDVV